MCINIVQRIVHPALVTDNPPILIHLLVINQSRISHPLTRLSTPNPTARRKQTRFYSLQSTLPIQVYQVTYNAANNPSRALSYPSDHPSINQLLLQFMKPTKKLYDGKKSSCLTLQAAAVLSIPVPTPHAKGVPSGWGIPINYFHQPLISQYRLFTNLPPSGSVRSQVRRKATNSPQHRTQHSGLPTSSSQQDISQSFLPPVTWLLGRVVLGG